MRKLITAVIVLSILSLSAKSQTSNPYSKLKYDKVVMYDFEGGKGVDIPHIIDDKGTLAKTVHKQVQLDKTEAATLSTKIGSKESYGDGVAACFEPHLGIVYYLNGKVVAHASICLDCNPLASSLDLPAQRQKKVGKGKDAYYLGDGMSKSFRKYLNGLLKKYSFSHQIQN